MNHWKNRLEPAIIPTGNLSADNFKKVKKVRDLNGSTLGFQNTREFCRIIGGGVPPSSPTSDPISDQNM